MAGLGLGYRSFEVPVKNASNEEIMLILRGIADAGHPRGELDDESAIEYARRLGFRGEVLDVPAVPARRYRWHSRASATTRT